MSVSTPVHLSSGTPSTPASDTELIELDLIGGEDGMTTAEYAVGTLAACALAGVLLFVVKDGAVKDAILGVITSALSTRG